MTTLRDLLRQVKDEQGELTTQTVVDAARPVEHPLHPRFEWDDSIAGEAWRREQAGQLIRSVKIRYAEEPPREVNAFVVVRQEETGMAAYVATEEAVAEPFSRELVLREMRRDWELFKRRYEHLVEFAELIGGATAA